MDSIALFMIHMRNKEICFINSVHASIFMEKTFSVSYVRLGFFFGFAKTIDSLVFAFSLFVKEVVLP